MADQPYVATAQIQQALTQSAQQLQQLSQAITGQQLNELPHALRLRTLNLLREHLALSQKTARLAEEIGTSA